MNSEWRTVSYKLARGIVSAVRGWWRLRPPRNSKDRTHSKEVVGLAVDLLLAIIFGVAPMPVAIRWLGWLACFALFLYVVVNRLTPLYQLPIKTKLVLGTIIVVVFVRAAWNTAHRQWVEEKAEGLEGDLVTRYDHVYEHTGPIIQFGPNGGCLGPYTGPTNVPVITAYNDVVDIKRRDGRLWLSTTTRDDQKNTIVQVRNNHWRVSNLSNVSWDHNYTTDALEVLDGHGRVVFQVRLFPDRVQLQEEWQWDKGAPNGGLFQAGKYDQKTGIKPMFKYPSKEHWGEFAEGPY